MAAPPSASAQPPTQDPDMQLMAWTGGRGPGTAASPVEAAQASLRLHQPLSASRLPPQALQPRGGHLLPGGLLLLLHQGSLCGHIVQQSWVQPLCCLQKTARPPRLPAPRVDVVPVRSPCAATWRSTCGGCHARAGTPLCSSSPRVQCHREELSLLSGRALAIVEEGPSTQRGRARLRRPDPSNLQSMVHLASGSTATTGRAICLRHREHEDTTQSCCTAPGR